MTPDDLAGSLASPQIVRLERLSAGVPGTLAVALTHGGPTGALSDCIALLALDALPSTNGPVVAAADAALAASLAAVCSARGRRAIVVVDGDLPIVDRNRIAAFGGDVRPCPAGTADDDVRSPLTVARRIAESTDRATLVEWDALDAAPFMSALQAAAGATSLTVLVPPGGEVLAAALRRTHQGTVLLATTDRGGDAETQRVEDRDAAQAARRAAAEEGLLTGMAGGTALAAALRRADRAGDAGPAETVIALLTGRGERALTTVFDDDWMRRHHLLPERSALTAGAIVARKGGAPREVVVLAPDARVSDAVRIMQELEISQIPIVDEGAVVGTVREDQVIDLLLHAPDSKDGPVSAVMDDPLPEVDGAASVEAVQELLVSGHTAVLVRLDGGGRDIVTKYDLIHGLTRS